MLKLEVSRKKIPEGHKQIRKAKLIPRKQHWRLMAALLRAIKSLYAIKHLK